MIKYYNNNNSNDYDINHIVYRNNDNIAVNDMNYISTYKYNGLNYFFSSKILIRQCDFYLIL